MKKFTNIIRWIITSIFLIMAVITLSDGSFLGALLFILGGAIIAPLNIISKFRKKLKLNKVLSIALSIVLFFAGTSTLSNTKVSTDTNDNSQISVTVSDNSYVSSEETNTSTNKESALDDASSKSEDIASSQNNTSSKESSSKVEIASSKEETTSKNNNSSEITSSIEENNSENNNSSESSSSEFVTSGVGSGHAEIINSSSIPAYSGNAYIAINNNIPNFSADELTTIGYETYSDLDSLGRTQTALASVGIETIPNPSEERGSISHIKPSGWNQATYDNISGKYLYNRCHLIGWQLSAENANKKNLITGTKYLNINGMLPFENMVADYISETNNHVAYRITPIYEGNNLLASGVQMEAYSIEDNGAGICFNVYCYNVQPEIIINYADGSSYSTINSTPSEESVSSKPEEMVSSTVNSEPENVISSTPEPTVQESTSTTIVEEEKTTQTVYITETGEKYHSTKECRYLKRSKVIYDLTIEEAKEKGYDACSGCH